MKRALTVINTVWGYMAAVWSDKGLWELGWPRPDRGAAIAAIETAEAALTAPDYRSEQLEQELNLYFKGFELEFATPVDWSGYTDFQRKVLQYTANIAYGKVETYGQVAAAVGSPKAPRAVGQSLHINRTPLVVPCHRVVGSDGNLTGFGGGLEMKRALLLLEQPENSELNIVKNKIIAYNK